MDENLEKSEQASYRQALIHLLYIVADDDLVVGHRGSEWLGMAPTLEDDIAFGSLSQDEIGHSSFYYSLLHELGEPTPDELVYRRQVHQWRNACVLAEPNGDWVDTVVRRYFYEVLETVRLEGLRQSCYVPLRDGVVKVQREERYHVLYLATWFEHLAQGGERSRTRLEESLKSFWPQFGELFSLGGLDDAFKRFNLFPYTRDELGIRWATVVREMFDRVQLSWPGIPESSPIDGRLGQQSQSMDEMLKSLTEVNRADPVASW